MDPADLGRDVVGNAGNGYADRYSLGGKKSVALKSGPCFLDPIIYPPGRPYQTPYTMIHATDAKYVPIGQSSLPGEDSPRKQCSTPRGVSPGKGHHHGHEDDGGKKSVMAKVKDKAKKWKNNLVRKKHSSHRPHKHDGIAHGLAGLVEEEDDDVEDNAAADPDMKLNEPPTEQAMNPKNGAELNDREAVKEPIEKQALCPSSLKHEEGDQGQEKNEVQYDKGVSVKEYLIQKLEPGEGERALSEVITDAITTNRGAPEEGEKTVVEMVKQVVSSFLGTEEPNIPVSTKPGQVEIEEERQLQPN